MEEKFKKGLMGLWGFNLIRSMFNKGAMNTGGGQGGMGGGILGLLGMASLFGKDKGKNTELAEYTPEEVDTVMNPKYDDMLNRDPMGTNRSGISPYKLSRPNLKSSWDWRKDFT